MATVIELKADEAGLFGYGSLLLSSSMERTLGHRYERERYVCQVRGWRRRWTALYPNNTYYFLDPDGHRCYPKNITYLNVEPDGRVLLNGLVYIITHAELLAFDRREAIYDRIQLPQHVIDADVIGGAVYMYVGKPSFVMTQPLPVEIAAIRGSYVQIIEDGLTDLGQEFRVAYEHSSDEPLASSIIADHSD